MRGDIRIGISGWRYEPWRGTFYPKGLAQRRELEYASRKLSTIEINGSFYSLQTPASYSHVARSDARWLPVRGQGRPLHHAHAAAPQRARRRSPISSPRACAELREKLGPFLWQFPPNFALRRRARRELPRDAPVRHGRRCRGRAAPRPEACDARRLASSSRSRTSCATRWRCGILRSSIPAFIALLRKYNVAFVVADTAGKWIERDDVTADFVYMRLHGAVELYHSRYSEEELERFATRIDCWARGREPEDAQPHRANARRRRRPATCIVTSTTPTRCTRRTTRSRWRAHCRVADTSTIPSAPRPCAWPCSTGTRGGRRARAR